MAWTQADIDTLEAAIKSGVRRVKYGGPPAREAEYHSLSEMRALLAEMRREVSAGPSYRLVSHTKGFR